MKRIILIFLIFFAGCSPVEFSRLFGVGLRPFRERGMVYAQTFDQDLSSCYEKINKKLRKVGASFYRGSQKQGFLVVTNFTKVFPQSSASTEVAIFFTEIENLKVQVEVASLNYSLAEFISSEIFNYLEGKEIEDIESEEEASLE